MGTDSERDLGSHLTGLRIGVFQGRSRGAPLRSVAWVLKWKGARERRQGIGVYVWSVVFEIGEAEGSLWHGGRKDQLIVCSSINLGARAVTDENHQSDVGWLGAGVLQCTLTKFVLLEGSSQEDGKKMGRMASHSEVTGEGGLSNTIRGGSGDPQSTSLIQASGKNKSRAMSVKDVRFTASVNASLRRWGRGKAVPP